MLVVDDDADSRELLAATLEHHGAVVLTASSVGEALEMLQKCLSCAAHGYRHAG